MRYVLACSLAALVVVLAGCGGKKNAPSNGEASKSASQIATDVRKAIASATSVHVVGSGSSGGEKLSIDLLYRTGAEGGGTGKISINGLAFDVTHVDGKSYFKGGPQFLSHFAGKQAAQLMAGKWFYVKSTGEFGSLAALTNLTALTNAIFSDTGTLSKGAVTTVDGQSVIPITDKTNGGTLYVATTGPAYPIEIAPSGGTGSGTISFEDWDKPVTLTAPKNPIDYAKLVASK